MKKAFLASAALHIGILGSVILDDMAAQDTITTDPMDITVLNETEFTIYQTCTSSDPLLVIDKFHWVMPDYGTKEAATPTIDLNGDTKQDVAHGDMVARVAELSGKDVMTYALEDDPDKPNTVDEANLAAALEDIVNLVKTGIMAQPSGIIMSMSETLTMEGINKSILPVYVPNSTYTDGIVTSANVAEKASSVWNALGRLYDSNSAKMRKATSIKRLSELNIPVYVAAGNDGTSEAVNTNSLMGTITIGSLTHDGSETAPYNTLSSLTQTFRKGDYIGRAVAGGIDINDDGAADFPFEIISDNRTIAEAYNGLTVTQLEEDPNQFEPYNKEPAYGSYWFKDTSYIFRENANGSVQFDPDGTGDESQRTLIRGTSFAAPAICDYEF